MKTATLSQPENVVSLVPKAPPTRFEERFKIQTFVNPRTRTESYRVFGLKRDGTRIRQNFSELVRAQGRALELNTEYLAQYTETSLRATKLSDTQLRLAEVAFLKLDSEQDLLPAVDYWLRHGKANAVSESPRLDDAFEQFKEWLKTAPMRPLSATNLRRRVSIFVNSVPNVRVSEVTPDLVFEFLRKRPVSFKSKDNDRRAVSRFFGWCAERPRRWTASNPCRREGKAARGEQPAPEILTLQQCEDMLRKASTFKRGRLAPYTAVCLFAGLRPFEAARLTWSNVNLIDREIRLEPQQTKTKQPRVIAIGDTLRAWLKRYEGKEFFPCNWRRDFNAIKAAAGFGTKSAKHPDLKPWKPDLTRHTAISHYFRQTGSYGQTAEQFGNSEAIIKKHYQGRVSTEDTKKFYALLPKKGGRR